MDKLVKLLNWVIYSLKLGHGPRDKAILLYMFLRWKLIVYVSPALRGMLPFPKVIHLLFRGRELSIHVADDNSFPCLFYEIFIAEDYRVDLPGPMECIIDAGAHYGLASLYFACLYPNTPIHAFEPCSHNFRHLQLNTQRFENIHSHQMGLYSKSGTTRLYLHASSGEHSLMDKEGRYEEIKTTTLDEFMSSQRLTHLDLLKIDVEGAEEEILTTTKALDHLGYIVGELHFLACSWPRIEQALNPYFKVEIKQGAPHCGVFRAANKRAREHKTGAI